MSGRRVLGTIRSSYAIEARALALLASYGPLYLDEVAFQAEGPGFTEPARPQVLSRTAAEDLAADDLPAVVLALEETSGDVAFEPASGAFAAAYRLRVEAVAFDDDAALARAWVAAAAAAASALLVQTLADPANGLGDVRWTGESVADLEVDLGASTRQLRHRCTHTLEVTVPDVLNAFHMPPDPTDPPQNPGDLPAVDSTQVTVTPVEEIDP